MSHFRREWQGLNFYIEYIFGFETLIFATLQILYMYEHSKDKENEIASYDFKFHQIKWLCDATQPIGSYLVIFMTFNYFIDIYSYRSYYRS